MSDMPERIKVAKCHPFTDPDDLYVCHPKLLNPAAVHYIRADIAQAELDAAVQAERDGIRSLAREITANTRGPSQYDVGYRDCAMFFDAAIRERGE